jgi:hypothetical protein
MENTKPDFRYFYERLNADLSEEDKRAGAQFLADTCGEDDLAIIIRAHVYMESTLTLLIEERLIEPGAFNPNRIGFNDKLGLAVALGAIPTELRGPLQILNTFRNRLAHDKNANITASDEDKLFKSFSKLDRERITGSGLSDCLSYLHGSLYGRLTNRK